jgi:hypothetical protein
MMTKERTDKTTIAGASSRGTVRGRHSLRPCFFFGLGTADFQHPTLSAGLVYFMGGHQVSD